MFGLSIQDLLFVMAGVIFVAGFITFWVGVFVLVRRSSNADLNAIASQTAQIAQKGITDSVAGLVGNASALINALNDLVHTQNGVGSFLMIIGLVLIAAGASLALYIFNKP